MPASAASVLPNSAGCVSERATGPWSCHCCWASCLRRCIVSLPAQVSGAGCPCLAWAVAASGACGRCCGCDPCSYYGGAVPPVASFICTAGGGGCQLHLHCWWRWMDGWMGLCKNKRIAAMMGGNAPDRLCLAPWASFFPGCRPGTCLAPGPALRQWGVAPRPRLLRTTRTRIHISNTKHVSSSWSRQGILVQALDCKASTLPCRMSPGCCA